MRVTYTGQRKGNIHALTQPYRTDARSRTHTYRRRGHTAYTHARPRAHVYVYTRTYTRTYIRAYVHARAHTHTRVHTYIRTLVEISCTSPLVTWRDDRSWPEATSSTRLLVRTTRDALAWRRSPLARWPPAAGAGRSSNQARVDRTNQYRASRWEYKMASGESFVLFLTREREGEGETERKENERITEKPRVSVPPNSPSAAPPLGSSSDKSAGLPPDRASSRPRARGIPVPRVPRVSRNRLSTRWHLPRATWILGFRVYERRGRPIRSAAPNSRNPPSFAAQFSILVPSNIRPGHVALSLLSLNSWTLLEF